MDKPLLLYYRGRVALYAELRALQVRPGDEVLTQAFTCVAVPEGIMAAGARPVFVDIAPNSYNMDPSDLESKISPRTQVIIVQHTFGIPAEMDQILAIAEQHGIPVIEDCCHTLASRYEGRDVGTFGVGSFYSFEWGKPIVAGIGGAAVINDPELQRRMIAQYSGYHSPPASDQIRLQLQYMAHRILYRPVLYWPVRWLFHTLSSIGAAESNYNAIEDGQIAEDFSLRMAHALEKRLAHKLRDLDAVSSHSREAVARYRREIGPRGALHPVIPSKADVIFARYPLAVRDKPTLLSAARSANVELAEWYTTPVHPLSGDGLSLVHYEAGSCPNAEARCREVVTLPTHPATSKRDIDHAVRLLNRVTG